MKIIKNHGGSRGYEENDLHFKDIYFINTSFFVAV